MSVLVQHNKNVYVANLQEANAILAKFWRIHLNNEVEHFIIMALNGSDQLIDIRALGHGTPKRVCVRPIWIKLYLKLVGAKKFYIAHNHPSNSHTPSSLDVLATNRIIKRTQMINVKMLDHLILTEGGGFSIRRKCQI